MPREGALGGPLGLIELGGWVGPIATLDAAGKREVSYLLSGIEPKFLFPACYLVTLVTTLSWLYCIHTVTGNLPLICIFRIER
jgi:hypothetical protein